MNIVIPSISFPSTRNVWLNRVKEGVEVKYVPAINGVVTEEMIIEAIDGQTMVLSICSVEPSSGYAYDLEYLGNYCHERSIYFVVDATQGFGAMPIDVKAMHIDYLVTSTYKWMCNNWLYQ